ncbi:TPA_asm: P6 [Corylus betacytorhabdovirus 1]|nr:TPA_asm: P6 [Corylus betacytorhabdovirus 1]
MDKLVLGMMESPDSGMLHSLRSLYYENRIVCFIYVTLIASLMIGIIRSVFALSHKILLCIGELSWLMMEILILLVMLSPLKAGYHFIKLILCNIINPILLWLERTMIRQNSPSRLILSIMDKMFPKPDMRENVTVEDVHNI